MNELTDMVEEAVYQEFERISERGGVLGAMDTMYQRGKIQEESLYYEHKKHNGSLPLVGAKTSVTCMPRKPNRCCSSCSRWRVKERTPSKHLLRRRGFVHSDR